MRELALALCGVAVATGLLAMVLIRLGQMGESPPLCASPSPTVGGLTYYCSQIRGHSGLHSSVDGALWWDDSHRLIEEGI